MIHLMHLCFLTLIFCTFPITWQSATAKEVRGTGMKTECTSVGYMIKFL